MDFKKKSTKKRTNDEKIAICERYETYLKIVHEFGHDIMLLKQLEEFALALDLVNNNTSFMYEMLELFDHDIIKTKRFFAGGVKTEHHIVILRKFALRYLKGETSVGGSQKVAPVPKLKSNDRILQTTFKSSFLLQRMIPSIKKQKEKVTIDDILNELERTHSSLFYKRNQGVLYAKKFYDSFKKHINEYEFDQRHKTLYETNEKRQEGLKLGSYSSKGKGKATVDTSGVEEGKRVEEGVKVYKASEETEKEKKETGEVEFFANKKTRKIYQHNFENMIRANMHVVRVEEVFDDNGVVCGIELTILFLDYQNAQNIYSIGTQIASTYLMFQHFLKNTLFLKIKVGIVAIDEDASISIKEKAKEMILNPFNRNEDKRITLTLRNWQMTDDMIKKTSIMYTNYEITERYLENKKLTNLLQDRPVKE